MQYFCSTATVVYCMVTFFWRRSFVLWSAVQKWVNCMARMCETMIQSASKKKGILSDEEIHNYPIVVYSSDGLLAGFVLPHVLLPSIYSSFFLRTPKSSTVVLIHLIALNEEKKMPFAKLVCFRYVLLPMQITKQLATFHFPCQNGNHLETSQALLMITREKSTGVLLKGTSASVHSQAK